jgi:diguanylate cyclase (GGDEF)-like protein
MDQNLNETLLNSKLEAESDDIFIREVNHLHSTNGNTVYRAALKLLAGIDVPQEQSEEHWIMMQEHRREMMQHLGRNVDITTALSDYLQTSTDFLDHPRLIEAAQYEDLINETIHDSLTGLFNRRYFDESYNHHASLAIRYRIEFSLLFLDIDNFKDINDSFGHLAGDKALRQVAAVIDEEKRNSDIAARYGGEEFILLLTHTDNVSGYVFAERLRKAIEKIIVIYRSQSFKVTVSGGLASFPFNSQDPEQLLEMADSAVYLSKGAGKNRITNYKDEKRRFLRVNINEPILAKELDFHNSQTFNATSKNICAGGILFENDEPLPIGALIKVKVPVTDSSPLILIGTVVRVESFGTGKYDIGMTTSFKEMDKIANSEIAGILRSENL